MDWRHPYFGVASPFGCPNSRFYGTTELPNTLEKAAGTIQDKLNKG
jgi:hypothetical protein